MKAIFFDIDGTIVENKDPRFPTPAVTNAIAKLKAAGHLVFIASGRSITYLDERLLKLNFDGYVLLNGATIFYKNKLIIKHLMDKEQVRELIKLYQPYGIEYGFLGPEQTYVKKEFTRFQNRLASYGITDKGYTTDFQYDQIEICKLELTSPDYKNKEIITKNLPANLVHVSDPFNTTECAIDVFPKETNKATGILELLNYLQIPVEDSYAFGDGDNDLEMLATVGHGFAMGNGTDGAKAAAKTVVPSVFDDGVAYGIEHYILK